MDERSEPAAGTTGPHSHSDAIDSATEAFVAHRNLLFTVAYEMLGSAADSEDVLQETWLRWTGVDHAIVPDQPAPAPIVGAGAVARVLGRIAAVALQPAHVNGHPALIVRLNGEIDTVMAVRSDDGLITGLYAVRNPEKLSYMERETVLCC
ncbi:hypothetical protein C1I98_16230 [Spongiactinospora gelatinilytica]|uniref:RNA polymerase sigma-70 region 2 domain-containing protein n=1 Tax=Spongiactinospora gelatinilytica TaxID=2666298 RepID=A0A2W2GAG3_9ACTN|nr:sigma factor [Spongiactinospora gelatinilytica]PZG44983.1 hypothetical protein C1I98_16230 [Spongiactinospora gelatinilytica]